LNLPEQQDLKTKELTADSLDSGYDNGEQTKKDKKFNNFLYYAPSACQAFFVLFIIRVIDK